MPIPDNCIPDNCIRGIPKPTCLEGRGTANLTLFEFHRNPDRTDRWNEVSINWKDDEHAIDFTLQQKNDEEKLLFSVGVAILPLVDLDKIRKRHTNFFHYERQSEPNNGYHGNLLLNDDTSKTRKTLIRAGLANCSEIHHREDIINQRRNNQRWYIVVWLLIKRCRNFIFSSRKRTKRILLTTRERRATEHGL